MPSIYVVGAILAALAIAALRFRIARWLFLIGLILGFPAFAAGAVHLPDGIGAAMAGLSVHPDAIWAIVGFVVLLTSAFVMGRRSKPEVKRRRGGIFAFLLLLLAVGGGLWLALAH